MAKLEYDGRDLEAMSFAERYHAWIVSLLRPYIGTAVAEVGAGSGSFTELLLKEQGVTELLAVEPSSEMYDRLVATTSHDARVTTKNDFFSVVSNDYQNHFDTVVYVNVLEHVPDDVSELAHVYKALQPGGHVCIFVPALMWLFSEHDKTIGHYRRYHKQPLIALLQGAGFEVRTVRFFDIIGILPWFIVMKLMRTSPAAGSVGLYDRVVVPVARMLESIITPPIGKNLLIVGRKPL